MRASARIWAAIALTAATPVLLASAAGAQRADGPNGDAYSADTMGDAVIEYDPETGSLIIITDEETNAHIGQIIEALDKPVPQVLIKVLFLEVTHNDDLDVGVDAFFQDVQTFDDSERVDESILETAFGVAAETRGGFYRLLEDDLNVTIRALGEVGKLEILSRPSILTRNNQEATITVGQEVPFIRNSRVTTDGQTINTVEYEDIGIILTVTPHISPDRVVEMEVIPEISTLTGETIQISETVNAPVFAKRSAETGVVVPDGKTVVIGGLMEDSETTTVRKVPLLGDIPFLGALFRRKITSETKTELLIFLTPHVVTDATELQQRSITEKNAAELAPKVFSADQMSRYVDNIGDETGSGEEAK
jgi:general secretion pathway protein D